METEYVKKVISSLSASSRKAEDAANELKKLLCDMRIEQADPFDEEVLAGLQSKLCSLSTSLRKFNSVKTQAAEIVREYERLEEDSLEAVRSLLLE